MRSLTLLTTLTLAASSAARPAHAQDCTVADAAHTAPANTTGNCYSRIGTLGLSSGQHPDCYYPISQDGISSWETFLDDTAARMPIYPPYRESDVTVGAGWMYNATDRHNATDYGRNGRTFTVHAVADGEVIWVGYMPSPGWVVIIEHTATDGSKYRTVLHHLRNGRDGDIRMARLTEASVTLNGGDWPIDAKWTTYQDTADQDGIDIAQNRNVAAIEARWGTNAMTLRVAEGQLVKAGQLIGWAGLTGVHGMNGSMTNVHLHQMFARRTMHDDIGQQWTFFDPYGLYALDKACYRTSYPSGADEHQHPSVYAPLYQDYAAASPSRFQEAFDYFASFGWFPQTFTVDRSTGSTTYAGTFRPANPSPVVRINRTFQQHQDDFDFWYDRTWVPKRVSAVDTAAGARYAAIYKRTPASGFISRHKQTTASFEAEWAGLYGQGWVVDDFSLYTENGQLFISSNRIKRSGGFGMRYGMTESSFATFHAQYTAQNLKIVQFQKYNHPGLGVRLAAVWMPLAATTNLFRDMSTDTYRTLTESARLNGVRVRHVDTYGGLHSLILEE